MNEKNALIYGIIAVVAVLVFVGAAIAVNSYAPQTYDVILGLAAANSTVTLYPYQSTSFNITVTNRGGKEIVGLPVAFYVNGVGRNYSTLAIPAHQSVTIEQNYTFLESGSYLFSAVADPGNVLKIANWTSARKSIVLTAALPQQAAVYQSVPNSNITYTDSFSTSGTGLLSASLMGGLYDISALVWVNGVDNTILAKTYQDLYPYVAVVNGAYSLYSNGSASYAAWLQGTVTPADVAAVVSSFGKEVSSTRQGLLSVEYSSIGSGVSLCSYYQGGWVRIVEYYNDSRAGTCLGMVGTNYTPSEGNVLVSALKSTKIGSVVSANQLNATKQIQWSHFYYNNATVLGQTVEYQSNAVAASTLFQLQSPAGVFLSRIEGVATNVSRVNTTCRGITSDINGTSICSVALPTTAVFGNQTFGGLYTEYISSNYIVSVYSLMGQSYLTLAHANAGELISRLGMNYSEVDWQSPYKSSCGFEEGLSCKFNGVEANGSVSMTFGDLNFSSVRLDNVSCGMGLGFPTSPINSTLTKGENLSVITRCYTIPLAGLVVQENFNLTLGLRYQNSPMTISGTLNVSGSG